MKDKNDDSCRCFSATGYCGVAEMKATGIGRGTIYLIALLLLGWSVTACSGSEGDSGPAPTEPEPNAAPSASITASPTSGTAPLSVDVSLSCTDADGTISEYKLDLDGDDTLETSSSSAVDTTVVYRSDVTARGQCVDSHGAESDTASAVVDITVRVTIYDSVNASISDMYARGDRFLAGATGEILQFTGERWETEYNTDSGIRALWISTSGVGWASSSGETKAVLRSPSPGNWSYVDGTGCHSGCGTDLAGSGSNNVVQLATEYDRDSSFYYPVVRQRRDTGWADLDFPKTTGDSTRQGTAIGTTGDTSVFVGSHREKRQFGGRGRADLARWNGSEWTFVDLPEPLTGTTSSALYHLTADRSRENIFGVIRAETDEGERSRLIRITGTSSDLIDHPLSGTDSEILGIAFGPDGTLYLAGRYRIVRRTTSGWEEFPLPEGWMSIHGSLWVEDSTTFWIDAMDESREHPENRAILQLMPDKQ